METAVKLLAFSQVIYADGTPCAAERDLHMTEGGSLEAAEKGPFVIDEVSHFAVCSMGFPGLLPPG